MKFIITLCFCTLSFLGFSQLFQPKKAYTRQDSLRGSITPERAWWNLQYYHLSVKVQPNDSTISGNNLITYKVLKPAQVIQIDLQNPMQITKVIQDGQSLHYKREGNAFFVELQKKQVTGKTESITVFYEGKPRVARRPPWDGGFSWKKDAEGKWFITTSCQGLGASVWWPCKDHMYDEADSMLISITVPKGLQDISNGRLLKVVDNPDDTRTFDWFVSNPINNYGVNINIGNYVHFSEKYKGLKGDLDCNYYVLPADLEKAKVQFKQVPMMLKAFEHWFGPYPFYEDGYKLVQVSYLGMEHQSSVTYGNHFANGYLGRDLSGTGWGLKWDFIIIHESGHEWFANNITDKDIADMWIHESFTNYSENLFTEYYYGKEAGAAYVKGCRKLIGNKETIIGDYEVNQGGSGDMYYKGGNMLHTIRQVIDNDEKWRQILIGLNKDFYHQTVDTKQIETYISKKSGINLSKVFDQYLRNPEIPTLEYKVENGAVSYRWTTCIDGFNMPVKIENATGKYQFIQPTTTWKSIKGIKDIKIDDNFYVNLKKV
ncbi:MULTISPECIES: M1 family metallopeptidase [unclassified Arcicella]|uniref:M1 family metallopeptidase n=1 Tax=unclassified Arcicella TaxID=2644986 RepID=UPI002862D892|nr:MULTISPECIES: M1 family metallopeptidase [unclassified Arcicella]MDR6564033.1 aminopeptidase N [Arcicella sp. BE51]MDR6813786.1 aminopeptidase N [Arcicella sp. BE140]MDR6825098.1 aminopeptidase N [Arcicella sp. BE139]